MHVMYSQHPKLGGNDHSGQLSALTEAEQQSVHQAACEIVAAELLGNPWQPSDSVLNSIAHYPVLGAFVTLKRRGLLRGCCGTLGEMMPLLEALQHAAVRTATQDVRLPPISASELPYLTLDVTLLHSFQPITAVGSERIAQVQIGRHGLQIQRGNHVGLLLPVVAVEHGLGAEQFLQQTCLKAGLPATAWVDEATQINSFEGLSIAGQWPEKVPAAASGPRFAAEDLERLAAYARSNVAAILRGATPSYYLPDCPDGTVAGVFLLVEMPGVEPLHLHQLSLRPGLPMQSTLFSLCSSAAERLRPVLSREEQVDAIQAHLTLLYDSALHNTPTDPDLRGFEPQERALIVMKDGRTAWLYDPALQGREVLHELTKSAGNIASGSVYLLSLAVQSTQPRVFFSSGPRPDPGSRTRPAAVAGMFYPGEADELERFVSRLLAPARDSAARWHAALVPHAGLIYSGRIAAATMQRLEFPPTVIILGPKHTRHGVRWAVAPHEQWEIPGATIAADRVLAEELAAAVTGLELDAAAHQQEHAIEVELPLLARLAPASRIVGIAVGTASLDECLQFGTELAGVLDKRETRPLLLISSDMHHFATDTENRRLDSIALAALQSLDPVEVYHTVMENHITMCGVLPAVIVLEALRSLRAASRAEQVAYGTSGDISGDLSRVVGYAGMLFG